MSLMFFSTTSDSSNASAKSYTEMKHNLIWVVWCTKVNRQETFLLDLSEEVQKLVQVPVLSFSICSPFLHAVEQLPQCVFQFLIFSKHQEYPR